MSYDPSYTTDEERAMLSDAMVLLTAHPDYLETLDVRDRETGKRVGYVVRLRGGREFEVRLRTDTPTEDTWDDRDWDEPELVECAYCRQPFPAHDATEVEHRGGCGPLLVCPECDAKRK